MGRQGVANAISVVADQSYGRSRRLTCQADSGDVVAVFSLLRTPAAGALMLFAKPEPVEAAADKARVKL
jgi:hypothetical protein